MKLRKIFIEIIEILIFTIGLYLSGFGTFVHAQVVATNNSCLDQNYMARFSTMYRQWNPDLVDHFYSNNATETGEGYKSENAVGHMLYSSEYATVPLYRYYSSSASDHFYSTSDQTPTNYTAEGIMGYIFPMEVPGSTPLYRSYRHIPTSPPNGDHLYTSSAVERDMAAQSGYVFEGIEGYVCSM